jgi:adenine-specific DNA methylase
MHDSIKDNGILVMFFAHSSVDAWDFVINSLQKAGFRITATWPVHTESTTNILARGHASMMSSIIIVARKRKSDKSGYIEEIQEEVEAHLKKRLDEFWKYGLRGADLTVSAMGSTLDIITQYSEIKSYTGEMKVKDVLELVQKYVAEYVLNRYIKKASGLDVQTSFYLYSR